MGGEADSELWGAKCDFTTSTIVKLFNNKIYLIILYLFYAAAWYDNHCQYSGLEGYTHDLCWPVAIEDPCYSMIIHCDHKIMIQSHVWNGWSLVQIELSLMIHFQNNFKLSDAQWKMIIIALGLVVPCAQVTTIPRSAGCSLAMTPTWQNPLTLTQ